MKKILITGSAGFIGFHLSKSYLDDGVEILGIDNINDYYDPQIKLDRLEKLNKKSNFLFEKMDITDYNKLNSVFNSFKPDLVVHLAAQAGVRYSIENPRAYLDSNLIGFFNILEVCRHNFVKSLIYASSSSVYGKNLKIPFSTNDRTDHPIALYGATKKANELMAHSYTYLYGLQTIGLRFFTVYGPWGRPDMAMYIFTKKILNNEPISVYNNGKMKRDFTYIDDIVSGIKKSGTITNKYEIFNLGNNKSEKLMDMIKMIENYIGKKAIIDFQPIQSGDFIESFADIKKSIKYLNYSPTTDIEVGIPKFIDWYKRYSQMEKN